MKISNAKLASELGLSLATVKRYRAMSEGELPRWLRLALAALDAGMQPAGMPAPKHIATYNKLSLVRPYGSNEPFRWQRVAHGGKK